MYCNYHHYHFLVFAFLEFRWFGNFNILWKLSVAQSILLSGNVWRNIRESAREVPIGIFVSIVRDKFNVDARTPKFI